MAEIGVETEKEEEKLRHRHEEAREGRMIGKRGREKWPKRQS